MDGYCVKCKAKRDISDGKNVKLSTGMKAYKGKCVTCGTGICRILGK